MYIRLPLRFKEKSNFYPEYECLRVCDHSVRPACSQENTERLKLRVVLGLLRVPLLREQG